MFPQLHCICPLVRDLTQVARQSNLEGLSPRQTSEILWDFLAEHEYEDPNSLRVLAYLEENYTNVRTWQKLLAQQNLIRKMFKFLLMNED